MQDTCIYKLGNKDNNTFKGLTRLLQPGASGPSPNWTDVHPGPLGIAKHMPSEIGSEYVSLKLVVVACC